MRGKEQVENVGADVCGINCACCGSESLAEGRLFVTSWYFLSARRCQVVCDRYGHKSVRL